MLDFSIHSEMKLRMGAEAGGKQMAVDQIAMRFWFSKYGFVKLDGLDSNSWQFSCHRCLIPWTKQPEFSTFL